MVNFGRYNLATVAGGGGGLKLLTEQPIFGYFLGHSNPMYIYALSVVGRRHRTH